MSRSPATAWRMPSRLEANPSAQVKPMARLRSMLSVVNSEPGFEIEAEQPEALQERTDAELAIGFELRRDAIRLGPLVVGPFELAEHVTMPVPP